MRSGEDKRVSKAMKERGGYWYTNDRLIEMLDITEDEQRHLKTIISKGERQRRQNEARKKARRNKAGLTQREQQKQDRIKAVKELAEQGLNQTEAAKEIGITKARVNQIINHELKS
jgi:DNA-directed RNA polymerase specialized sigma subunit